MVKRKGGILSGLCGCVKVPTEDAQPVVSDKELRDRAAKDRGVAENGQVGTPLTQAVVAENNGDAEDLIEAPFDDKEDELVPEGTDASPLLNK